MNLPWLWNCQHNQSRRRSNMIDAQSGVCDGALSSYGSEKAGLAQPFQVRRWARTGRWTLFAKSSWTPSGLLFFIYRIILATLEGALGAMFSLPARQLPQLSPPPQGLGTVRLVQVGLGALLSACSWVRREQGDVMGPYAITCVKLSKSIKRYRI